MIYLKVRVRKEVVYRYGCIFALRSVKIRSQQDERRQKTIRLFVSCWFIKQRIENIKLFPVEPTCIRDCLFV